MRLIVFASYTSMMLVLSASAWCGVSQEDMNTSSAAIEKVLRGEYASYRKTLVGNGGLKDAQVSIALLEKTKGLFTALRESQPTVPDSARYRELSDANREVWKLCLRLMHKTTDQTARELIMFQWQHSLAAEGAPSQFDALAEEWDPGLLTSDFWGVLERTKNLYVLSSICHLLYVHGNEQDIARLQGKFNALENDPDTARGELRAVIQNTIDWMKYRLSGNNLALKPATAPPVSESRCDPAIARVLQADYAIYEKAQTGDRGMDDARACITLMSKAKDLLAAMPVGADQRKDAMNAYCAAWRICLHLMHSSGDEKARQLILDEWNKSLEEDGQCVAAQIFALYEQWDRQLLTAPFWGLFERTNDPKTIEVVSYVLYVYGGQEDVKRLSERLKHETDSHLRRLMVDAINYMRYRLKGDKTDPGPAAIGPRFPRFE